jgi:hypothetical protein
VVCALICLILASYALSRNIRVRTSGNQNNHIAWPAFEDTFNLHSQEIADIIRSAVCRGLVSLCYMSTFPFQCTDVRFQTFRDRRVTLSKRKRSRVQGSSWRLAQRFHGRREKLNTRRATLYLIVKFRLQNSDNKSESKVRIPIKFQNSQCRQVV